MTDKRTKAQLFNALKDIVIATEVDNQDEFIQFIDNELAILDKRKATAKARQAKKRAEGDELTKIVYNALTDKPKTNTDIIEEINDEAVTAAKVTARLTKLINQGLVEKQILKIEGKKRTAYVRIGYAQEPLEEGPELDLDGDEIE